MTLFLIACYIYTAVPKPEIDFVREVLTVKDISMDLTSIDDILIMSKSSDEFYKHVILNFTDNLILKIEQATHGQSENSSWYQFRKGVITASKSHEVKTKMEKVVELSICGACSRSFQASHL